MNIRYLKSSNEAPLLLPGMELEANQENDPVADGVETLMASFQTWLSERNYGLSDMADQEIYVRLFKLLGGPRTPRNNGQVPYFHGILNECCFKAIRMKQAQPQDNQVPLLPTDVESKN